MNLEQNPCIEVLIGEDVDAEILENFHQDRDVFFEAEALVGCGAVAGCQTGAMMMNLCVSGYHPISKRKRKNLHQRVRERMVDSVSNASQEEASEQNGMSSVFTETVADLKRSQQRSSHRHDVWQCGCVRTQRKSCSTLSPTWFGCIKFAQPYPPSRLEALPPAGRPSWS